MGVLATAVRFGDPAAEIVAEAEERTAAAVVMATHGRTGVMRSVLGSVAGQVVHTGMVPVALVRPDTVLAVEPLNNSRLAVPTG